MGSTAWEAPACPCPWLWPCPCPSPCPNVSNTPEFAPLTPPATYKAQVLAEAQRRRSRSSSQPPTPGTTPPPSPLGPRAEAPIRGDSYAEARRLVRETGTRGGWTKVGVGGGQARRLSSQVGRVGKEPPEGGPGEGSLAAWDLVGRSEEVQLIQVHGDMPIYGYS